MKGDVAPVRSSLSEDQYLIRRTYSFKKFFCVALDF